MINHGTLYTYKQERGFFVVVVRQIQFSLPFDSFLCLGADSISLALTLCQALFSSWG